LSFRNKRRRGGNREGERRRGKRGGENTRAGTTPGRARKTKGQKGMGGTIAGQ